MKVNFISPSFFPAYYYGGPIYSTYYLAKELSRIGINVNVCTTDINGSERLNVKINKFTKLSENFFVKYYKSFLKTTFSIKMFLFMWRDILNTELIYLISVFSPSTPYSIFFSILFKKPILISPRGQLGVWPLSQNKLIKILWLNIFIKPFAKHIVWHSTASHETDEIVDQFPGAKIIEIPNGVKLLNFETETIKSPKYFSQYFQEITESSKIIFSLSRLHKKKGYDILIEAFRMVIDKIPNTYLIIAGEDFGERKILEKMIKGYELSNRMKIIDKITDEREKNEFLFNADLFALASHNENFGMVYAEALAAGTPIVATKNTPWDEVEKYNCGKWVKNSPQNIADAIIELLNSDVKKLGKNGQRLVAEKYDWSKTAGNFKTELERIINNK